MVRIYYHIYAVDGVESIIDEQLNLIEKHFDFPYILNIGISLGKDNMEIKKILKRFYDYNRPNYRIRDVRIRSNEFVTLDLIEEDFQIISDTDYILYLHTKGASRQSNNTIFENIISWRHIMQYFLVEKYKSVFRLFENTDFNSYGILLSNKINTHYSGNFWWAKGSYVKTINTSDVEKRDRYKAESHFLQMGNDWKPYSPYNEHKDELYHFRFKREEYAK